MAIKIGECRSCGCKILKPIISLGNHYISGFVDDEKDQGEKVPLSLVLCEDCKLLQMEYSAPPESMWNEQYWYKSGINSIIRNDLKDIVINAERMIKLEDGDTVIDIGNNDGTMFENYRNKRLNLIGFEPCKNVAEESKAKGFAVINDFFNAEAVRNENKAKVITAISMFYDVEDPNKFLEDIKKCLDKDGLFVIQQNYLVTMLEKVAFCNTCHEHREYYTLKTLTSLLERHGLEIFDVELNGINGGSIRTYIKSAGNKNFATNGAKIDKIINNENFLKLDTLEPYLEFAKKIENNKKELLGFIHSEKKKGKKFCGLGASTRGNTICQAFGLNSDLIECIFDKNPDKWGRKTVGSLIPVRSPEDAKDIEHDYQIVFIWSIFAGVGEDELEFLERGGKFILPLPKFKIVSNENI